MKIIKSFDSFLGGNIPNENWNLNKIKQHFRKYGMWDKYREMGVVDKDNNFLSYERPEGKKWEPIIKETIEKLYSWLSDEDKKELFDWYFDENYYYKNETPSKFNVGDEVYYYFNAAQTFNRNNNPRIYKDIVKSVSVSPDSWLYTFEKDRHNTNEYGAMIDEDNVSDNIEELKQRLSNRLKVID